MGKGMDCTQDAAGLLCSYMVILVCVCCFSYRLLCQVHACQRGATRVDSKVSQRGETPLLKRDPGGPEK